MNDTLCPNCREVRIEGDSPCSNCGWMPLRTTELTFVDDEESRCVHCSQPRPDAAQACPHCGHRGGLEPLAQHTANFHIFGLLFVTTLTAVCFALSRLSLGLGIPAFLIAGLALYRTILLIRERKKHRYPVSSRDLLRLFWWNVLGILAGLAVFILLLVGLQMVIMGVAAVLMEFPRGTMNFMAALLMWLNVIPGLVLVWRRKQSRGAFLLGVGATLIATAVVVVIETSRLHDGIAFWVSLMALLTLACMALGLAGRRGGFPRVQSFLIGWALSCCALFSIVMLQLPNGAEDGLALFCFSGVLLWPIMGASATLSHIWSWDDAFPAVISSSVQRTDTPASNSRTVMVIEEDGIEFDEEDPAQSDPPTH